MSSNFVSGLVSGIDSAALIDALVRARSGPVLLLEQRQARKTAELTAWKSLEAILLSLKVETDRLANDSLWDTPLVSSTDDEILTATASSGAAPNRYAFHVEALAQSHQVSSQAYSSLDDLVGTGTLSITRNGETTDIAVEAGTTLSDLADLINEADAGFTATTIRSVAGGVESYHLVLTADQTGAQSQFAVASTLSGGTAPDFSSVTRTGQDATVLLGGEGGLAITSATNHFEEIVEGVDVTVHRTHEDDDFDTVEIGRNLESVEGAVRSFVEGYNAAMGFLNDQFRYDPDVGTVPPLLGDGTLTAILGGLRSRVMGTVEGLTGDYRSLFSIGIRSGNDGELSIDEGRLRDALENDFESVANLFRPSASFDADGVEWLSAPLGVDLEDLRVDVEITSAATRAVLRGDPIEVGSGLTIDATNDSFRISIDGSLSETLTIAHGTYTDGDALAAAIADAIEGSDDLGLRDARVSFEDEGGGLGRIVLSSTKYGSAATLTLQNAGSNFAADLGLSSLTGQTAAGTDVVGTINGVAADGTGQILAVPDGEDLAGLTFRVTLTDADVPGTRVASFAQGIGRAASTRLLSLTDAADGTLSRVGSSLQKLIDRIDHDIDRQTELLELRRVRLMRRYARLESVLGQLQSQGNFIDAQLQSLRAGFGVNDGR